MRAKTWKALIVAALAVVILTAAVGGTMAWLSTKTQDLTNTFEPAKVTCKVVEPGWVNGTSTTKSNVSIQNTGTTDAYIRAMIVANWCTADNKVVKTASPTYEGLPGSDWVKHTDGFYYYTLPVAPNQTTSMLFTKCEQGTVPEGADHLEVNIICQAVQSTPANAVTEAWGVTVGADGNLTPGN